ncbi:SDR family oxidoreductase [Agromyces mediolanus]|uniref:SDR family oxidoreductase n=1 Tax=Agromyces mediolanus TaxID=41986 RepID=UPI0020416204|nr:SDR family oxidoreductase [Agromyces mediolanus]MCM3656894.1 SDR family oxidoreductase [Agromyces mediolanus]
MPVALVTGAGRRNGIAHAIAVALAEAGWDLAVTSSAERDREMPYGGDPDRDPAVLERELLAHGARTVRIDADLADPDAPGELIAAVDAELGPVSALVLSHAYSVDSGLLDTSIESFDRHFAVNTRAAWLLIRAFAAQIPAGGGSVVALTSDHTVGNLPYGASKGALDRIVIAAARELGSLGIRCNLVNPGPVDTGWMDDETRTALTAAQPSGRLGTPDDAARLVRFLASDEGRWVTGQLIHSDGGFSV